MAIGTIDIVVFIHVCIFVVFLCTFPENERHYMLNPYHEA